MLCGIAMMGLSACSAFFEPDNNTMLKGDDYIKEASEMYAGFLGVATKMQATEMSTCMRYPIMNRT